MDKGTTNSRKIFTITRLSIKKYGVITNANNEVAYIVGGKFAATPSDSSYSDESVQYKERQERRQIQFRTNNIYLIIKRKHLVKASLHRVALWNQHQCMTKLLFQC